MSDINENTIEITEYKLLGKLSDPFTFNDGSRVKTPEDWKRRRKEICKSTIDLQYGTMPPAPDFLEVEPLYLGGEGKPSGYRIKTGTRENPIVFKMVIIKARSKKAPAVISGDLCFQYTYDKEYIDTFIKNDINLVLFDRTELAPDIAEYNLKNLGTTETYEYREGRRILDMLETGCCGGQVKAAYPGYSFGATGAWAWGYSRCVDALELLGNVDTDFIAFTGHSRGGKTAALAGAVDTRARIVNPNATCAGGNSGYRISIKAKNEYGKELISEPLENIFRNFPSWMGQELKEYIGREDELPFDSHYLKALVAPRILFVSEAASDIWANPVGSYQTTEAASEVFKFLGCEENLYWYFRSGTHYHKIEDIAQLVNIINHVRNGEALNDKFFRLPFKYIEKAYDWVCPDKE